MKRLLPFITLLVGLGMIIHAQRSLAFDTTKAKTNILHLKESPYGEVIAMALQEPVHLLWHAGQGHQHVLHDDNCATCTHDSGSDYAHVHDHTHEHPISSDTEVNNPLVRSKKYLLGMESAIRQANDPKGRSQSTRDYEKKRVLEITQLAYEMDPTNYGNYNALSFFYATSPFFKENRDKAVVDLANKTIKACQKGIDQDPENSLTAASAFLNVLLLRSKELAHEEFDTLLTEYQWMVYYTQHFQQVYDKAYHEGRLQSFSQEKLDNWISYFKQFNYSIEGFGKKIQKAIKEKEARTSS